MTEARDSRNASAADTRSARAGSVPRKRLSARRLLVATIGAATVNFTAGCRGALQSTSVANLMAAPYMAPPDQNGDAAVAGSRVDPLERAGAGGVSGASGRAAAANAAGAGGTSSANPAVGDEDAGARDEDAGTPGARR
jgi:hypothetical protein